MASQERVMGQSGQSEKLIWIDRECDQSAWGQQKTVSSVSLKVFRWGRRLVHFGTDRNVDTW